jgi:hypothetical protein
MYWCKIIFFPFSVHITWRYSISQPSCSSNLLGDRRRRYYTKFELWKNLQIIFIQSSVLTKSRSFIIYDFIICNCNVCIEVGESGFSKFCFQNALGYSWCCKFLQRWRCNSHSIWQKMGWNALFWATFSRTPVNLFESMHFCQWGANAIDIVMLQRSAPGKN